MPTTASTKTTSAFTYEETRQFVMTRPFLVPRYISPEERKALMDRDFAAISNERLNYIGVFAEGWLASTAP